MNEIGLIWPRFQSFLVYEGKCSAALVNSARDDHSLSFSLLRNRHFLFLARRRVGHTTMSKLSPAS